MSVRSVLHASVLFLAGTFCFSVEMTPANGQGILQRIRSRMQQAAPQPQYRPQYRPQAAPQYTTPSASRQTPSASRQTLGSSQPTQRNTNPAQTQAFRIDPRTGRSVAVPTPSNSTVSGRPIQVVPPRTSGPTQGQQAQPSLGLRVVQAASGSRGLEVLKIQNHSLAGEAGLKVGDRIVAMNGQPIDDVKSLSRAIQSTRVGTTGVLRVVRGDRVADLSVPVVTRPIATDSPSGAATNTAAPNATTVTTSQPRQDNGVRLGVDIEDRPGVRGVIITSVTPNSPAATAGIQTGDRLVAVDGRMVVNSSALKQELSTRSKNNPMSIQLVRGSQVRASTVSFSANPANSSRTQTGPVADSKPSQSRTSASGSMFGNVGSMVGNLFGNAKTEATGTPDSNDVKKTSMTKQSNQPVTPIESTSKNSEQLPKVNDGLSLGKSILVQSEPAKPEPLTARPETTTPVVQPKPKENGSPIAQVDHTDDEMAFGDDEPINNAVFSQPLGADALSVETIPERSLETASSSAKTPSSDPPSAANITPPTSSRELELNPPENLSSSTKERIKALESELQRLKKLLGDQ